MLKIYVGPMYSGKTTELIRNYNRFRKYNQLIIDYDTSNNNSYINNNTSILYNHNNQKINCYKTNNINHFIQNNLDIIQNVKYIHINEAQFFQNLKNIVITIIEKYNINVYLYGLDGDFKREKFGEIIDLIPYCDSIIKLNGVCNNCHNNSLFSHRICSGNQQTIFNDEQENKYIPLCRQCYMQKNNNI